MNRLVLQVTEVIPPSFWEKAADQLFSILLLGVLAYTLWRKLTAVEDKMTKYLEDDRKQMMEVIENNTRAFERLYDKIQL
jgi:hypothetical protein